MKNKPQLLRSYIREHYNGNASAFARAQGMHYGLVRTFLKGDFVVVNGVVYKPKMELVNEDTEKLVG